MPEFFGMTANKCPKACTEKHCVISTIAVCKHPFKTADNGCGPITLRNREAARKFIGDGQVVLAKETTE